jgi:hypothetical protein
MPATLGLTEETVHRVAPDDKAVQTARDLVRKKKFRNLGVSADGTWLLAQCQGSARDDYVVSVDLGVESAPVGRCTCPSRKFPCKHALGLMLAYLGTPEAFAEREPPADLLAKRAKQAQRAQKQAEGPAAPRKVNQAPLAKKAAAQHEGLDLLEKIVTDLVAAGQWYEASHLDRIERQALQMSDAYLPGARITLRQLALLGRREDVSDEVRNETAASIFTRLWATVQRGRNYLDDGLAGDETQAEADAVIEEVLGKAWQLTELRDKGYCRQKVQLLELAHTREDDWARQERVEISHLLDLREQALYQAITYRPFKGLERVPGQPSYSQPLLVSEAAVYPGFLTRRIRWDKGAEQPQPLQPAHLQAAYAAAAPSFEAPLAAFRQMLKNPLNPGSALAWLRCRTVGRVGDEIVLEAAQGNRLVARDRNGGQGTVTNLVRAAGMLLEPAVLVRLFLEPAPTRICAQPLAALTSTTHLRLGL